MAQSGGPRPKIKIQCPSCEEDLKLYSVMVESNSASWALTHASHEHLLACPNKTILKTEDWDNVTVLMPIPEPLGAIA